LKRINDALIPMAMALAAIVPLFWIAGFIWSGSAGQEPAEPTGRDVVASYYGAFHHGKQTASGEPFDMRAMTAAHKTLPFGTRVRVTNPENGKTVVVRINGRGPYTRGRELDLSRGAAETIDIIEAGTARVVMEVLDD